MYKYKTYQGKIRQFLKTVSTDLLIDRFINYIDEDTVRKTIIKLFSNPHLYTLSYIVDELFKEDN